MRFMAGKKGTELRATAVSDGTLGSAGDGRQENVRGLQVAVHHSLLVGEVNSPCKRLHEADSRLQFLRIAAQVLHQIAFAHILKHQVRNAVRFADVVDLHDIGMMQTRDRFGFLTKPGQVFGAHGGRLKSS